MNSNNQPMQPQANASPNQPTHPVYPMYPFPGFDGFAGFAGAAGMPGPFPILMPGTGPFAMPGAFQMPGSLPIHQTAATPGFAALAGANLMSGAFPMAQMPGFSSNFGAVGMPGSPLGHLPLLSPFALMSPFFATAQNPIGMPMSLMNGFANPQLTALYTALNAQQPSIPAAATPASVPEDPKEGAVEIASRNLAESATGAPQQTQPQNRNNGDSGTDEETGVDEKNPKYNFPVPENYEDEMEEEIFVNRMADVPGNLDLTPDDVDAENREVEDNGEMKEEDAANHLSVMSVENSTQKVGEPDQTVPVQDGEPLLLSTPVQSNSAPHGRQEEDEMALVDAEEENEDTVQSIERPPAQGSGEPQEFHQQVHSLVASSHNKVEMEFLEAKEEPEDVQLGGHDEQQLPVPPNLVIKRDPAMNEKEPEFPDDEMPMGLLESKEEPEDVQLGGHSEQQVPVPPNPVIKRDPARNAEEPEGNNEIPYINWVKMEEDSEAPEHAGNMELKLEIDDAPMAREGLENYEEQLPALPSPVAAANPTLNGQNENKQIALLVQMEDTRIIKQEPEEGMDQLMSEAEFKTENFPVVAPIPSGEEGNKDHAEADDEEMREEPYAFDEEENMDIGNVLIAEDPNGDDDHPVPALPNPVEDALDVVEDGADAEPENPQPEDDEVDIGSVYVKLQQVLGDLGKKYKIPKITKIFADKFLGRKTETFNFIMKHPKAWNKLQDTSKKEYRKMAAWLEMTTSEQMGCIFYKKVGHGYVPDPEAAKRPSRIGRKSNNIVSYHPYL